MQSKNQGRNFKFCQEIVELDTNMTGAGIILKGELLAMFSKANALPPSPKRFHNMLLQVTIIWSIIKQNEDFFGKNKYFAIHSEKSDMLFFPLRAEGAVLDNAVLAIEILQPYDEVKLSQEIIRLSGNCVLAHK